ncbi:MAG: hypothetical protein EWV58_00545 [Microcystis aeruginosa Ma_MB_F_20061100_S19]|nr:MAG: hypothetical protein EWV59_22350 [Microcystis aeruginosa Ma_MB_F_20061100_S19D]TRU18936.1 MAG: hypothetical protein EWV58_00545 [Microcystis aeruginosa Ma_MB_F_20061100_S19]
MSLGIAWGVISVTSYQSSVTTKDFNFYPHYYTYGCGKSWRFFLAKTLDKIGDLTYTFCTMGIRACLRTLHF